MSKFTVKVKWNKELFTDLEVDTSEPTEVFKGQLMALTDVEPARQKVILGGTTLKDTWDGFKGLKNGVTMRLMATLVALPPAPTEKTVFQEDMTDEQLAKQKNMPAGLENLGNTCYMNATVQCLRSIPELCRALADHHAVGGAAAVYNPNSITDGFQQLVRDLETASAALKPEAFLGKVFTAFPQFNVPGEHGGYKQQDAKEFWQELLRCLQLALIRPSKSKSFVDEFMSIGFEHVTKCLEADELTETRTDTQYQLDCFIEANVKHMQTGLKSGMTAAIQKRSPILERDADYECSSVLTRLPAYLTIQLMRFQFKQKQEVVAKILKDIKFTATLDLYEMCSPELQKKLTPMRDEMSAEDKRREEAVREAQLKGEPLKTDRKSARKPFHFEDDEGSNNSGLYELKGVLTHKGRTSVGGHYVAWVRRNKGDKWVMYDDDNVHEVTLEQVLQLSGGGDWHTAYILLYGPKILEIEEIPEATQESEPMQE